MKAVERHIEEIKRYQDAITKTNSAYLKNDYAKRVNRMIKELREYCHYRKYNFKKIIKEVECHEEKV